MWTTRRTRRVWSGLGPGTGGYGLCFRFGPPYPVPRAVHASVVVPVHAETPTYGWILWREGVGRRVSMAMKEDGRRVYRGEKVTVACRRVLNAFGRVCPCGPPCPRPWPRGERKVPFVSLFRPVTILPFFPSFFGRSSFSLIDTHSVVSRALPFPREPFSRWARRKREDWTETEIRGWAGWVALLHSYLSSSTEFLLAILHSYYARSALLTRGVIELSWRLGRFMRRSDLSGQGWLRTTSPIGVVTMSVEWFYLYIEFVPYEFRSVYIYILEVSFLRDLKISVDSLIMDKSKLNFLDS